MRQRGSKYAALIIAALGMIACLMLYRMSHTKEGLGPLVTGGKIDVGLLESITTTLGARLTGNGADSMQAGVQLTNHIADIQAAQSQALKAGASAQELQSIQGALQRAQALQKADTAASSLLPNVSSQGMDGVKAMQKADGNIDNVLVSKDAYLSQTAGWGDKATQAQVTGRIIDDFKRGCISQDTANAAIDSLQLESKAAKTAKDALKAKMTAKDYFNYITGGVGAVAGGAMLYLMFKKPGGGGGPGPGQPGGPGGPGGPPGPGSLTDPAVFLPIAAVAGGGCLMVVCCLSMFMVMNMGGATTATGASGTLDGS